MLNISHHQTTAYHSEAFALHARDATATWAEEIPWVLLSLCSQPRENSSISPANAVYGPLLVLRSEFLQVEEYSVDQIIKGVHPQF
jgi:hypothetical protein